MRIWEMNRRILEMYNSCYYADFSMLMDQIFRLQIRSVWEPEANKLFHSKWYIWNWIRPRDFYKMMARYICEEIMMKEFEIAEFILNLVLDDPKVKDHIKKTFVWNITKQTPLITLNTLKYMSADRIHNILTGEKEVVSDEFLRPVLMVILSYRDELATLQGGRTIENNDL